MKNDIIMNPTYNILEEEKTWVKKRPAMGDHIRVNRGLYSHHGIYVSDEEVIHFTGNEDDSILDWSKPEVISSDIEYFLKGDTLEVREYTDDELEDLYPVDHIVQYARACLGDKGYNLIFNNCEHFANTCTLGRFRSKQVEDVFGSLLKKSPVIVYGGKNMGFWGDMSRALKGLFGGRKSSSSGSRSVSSTTTTYEPDKVKVAEIEANSKIRLAEMEIERIDLIKKAQIELLELNTNCEIAIEEAKAKSLYSMAQTIANLQTQLNEMAAKRLEIIEKGSIPIIKEIETFYDELGKKIREDHDIYKEEKLPLLLNTLEQYEEGSASYKIYSKCVETDMQQQFEHYNLQINAALKRQNQVIDGFIKSKENIINQTQDITKGLIDTVQMQLEQNAKLALSQDSKDHILQLENKNTKLLGE